jgi:transketolase
MASYFEAAKGAYLIRDYNPNQPKMGVVFVQGTSTTANVVKILPQINQQDLNIKIIAAISHELFLLQNESYKNRLVSQKEWFDSMIITNSSKEIVSDWISNPVSGQYSLSSDWDNRWRTGGTVYEVCEESRISPEWLLRGIKKFVNEREVRLERLRQFIPD